MNMDKNIQKFPKDDDLFFFGAHSNFLWNKFIEYVHNKYPEQFNTRSLLNWNSGIKHENESNYRTKCKESLKDRFPQTILLNAYFNDYKAEKFEIESSLPTAEIPLFSYGKFSSSLITANNLINLISSYKKIESKCVLLSKDKTNLFINGQHISQNTRVRYLFSAKFISQVIIATNLSCNKELNLIKDELSYGKPFDYIPYLLAEEIFSETLNLTSASICKKTCYFINIFPKIISNYQTNGNLLKKIVSIQKLFKDEIITDTEFNVIQSKFDDNISFEVECNLEYDEKTDIVNISFGDEVIIDCWLGRDSVFFSFPNFISTCYILKLFSSDESNNELICCGNYIQNRNFFIELNKKLEECYHSNSGTLNKNITLSYYPTNQKNPVNLSANFYLLNKCSPEETKYTPPADFICSSIHNKVLGCYASQIIKEQDEKYGSVRYEAAYGIVNKPLGRIRANQEIRQIKFKKLRLINTDILRAGKIKVDMFRTKNWGPRPHKIIMQSVIESAVQKSNLEYLSVIDNIFSLINNRNFIEFITEKNSRAFYFSVLEAICIFYEYDTNNIVSSTSLCNFMESSKKNIIYVDHIKLEHRKREEEAKLLVRNLRHSINNTSEAVLANLKEAIEIVNKKGADNQSTLNHLYSCNDEVAALRNTVLKFCHDIIDQDSISNLYHDSYTVVYGDKTVTIKEILFSSLFMAIKQLIKNIRFKPIREAYQKEKNISLKDDLLFNKFKDYIGLKYHRSFAELTFEEMLSDKTLYKDYSSYVFKVAASSDFDNLYNVFVQKRDFNSIKNFLEKYFFSDVNLELISADLSIREASYASYLLTDLLNEVCLNTLKYSLPNSSLKVLQSIQDNYLEIKILNETNNNLKGCYGSGTGLSGQQAVVRKIGGYIEKALDPTTNQFSLTVKLPIHG